MSKRGKWNDDALQRTTDMGEFDRELTALSRSSEDRPEFVAPGAEQKWRARNLLDVHWNLANIECPESYNRILSCIIDHANPKTGLCYPSQSIIAIETGYSRHTVNRAIRWSEKQGFLKTERRGLARALAYHPQWNLLESFWLGVTSDIEEQKASCRTQDATHESHLDATCVPPLDATRVPHHGATHNLKLEPQTITPKNEPHPERVISPSVKVTDPLEGQIRGKEEEGIQGEPFMEAPSFSEIQRRAAAAHTRLEADLRRLPGSHYSAVVEWLPYPGEVYDAAIAAEIDAPNTGVVVVLDAYRKEKAA